ECTALSLIPDNATDILSNQTDSSQCPSSEAWNWLYAMQPIYMGVICVLGFIGNAFVLSVFCFHKKHCTVAEIYLGNLAAADLLMVSCLPFWAITVANMFEWHFGHSLCQFINVGISMNMYCSIYFLVLVSIDRYLALVKTMSHGRMRSVSCAKISCFTIWMFGFIMSIPVMLFRTPKYFPEYNVTACYLEYPSLKWETSYNLLLSLIGFFIPLLIISYCTYKIIEALRNKKMHKFNTVKTEGKASFLVLSVLLVFFLCWIPFHSTTFLHILFNNGLFGGCVWEVFLDISNQVSSYLAYSNSCLNPVLYVIVGKNFRKKAKEVIEQMFYKRGSTSESSRSQYLSTLKTFV
uniref:B2 bradykinin receptor n=2 Tax=Lepisosteus oculatus TaxID=7918 RepID=W5NME3_LEPOC